MRTSILIALLILTFAFWVILPELLSSGHITRVLMTGIMALAILLAAIFGAIGWYLYGRSTDPATLRHVLIFITFINAAILVYVIYEKVSHDIYITKSIAEDNAHERALELMKTGASSAEIVAAIPESYSWRSDKTRFTLYMGLAMRSKKNTEHHISQLQSFIEDQWINPSYLDEYLEHDFQFFTEHDNYRKFFEILITLIGENSFRRYELNDVYTLESGYILENFSFMTMLDKGYEDLAISALKLINSPIDIALQSSQKIKNEKIKFQATNYLLKNINYEVWKDVYKLDNLHIAYNLLQNNNTIKPDYLDSMFIGLKRIINQTKPENWEYTQTQATQESFMQFYEATKGKHPIIELIPQHITDYYLAKEKEIQKSGVDNYRWFTIYITQGSLAHPYTNEPYKAYINGKLEEVSVTDMKGKIKFKVHGAKPGDIVLVMTAVANTKAIFTSLPVWDTKNGAFNQGENGKNKEAKFKAHELNLSYERIKNLENSEKDNEEIAIIEQQFHEDNPNQGWINLY